MRAYLQDAIPKVESIIDELKEAISSNSEARQAIKASLRALTSLVGTWTAKTPVITLTPISDDAVTTLEKVRDTLRRLSHDDVEQPLRDAEARWFSTLTDLLP